MDFRLKDGEKIRTRTCLKGSSTVIEAGDLVALSSGLIIKAVAGSTAIGWAPNGAGNGATEIDVTIGNDFTLKCTGSTTFAVTDKGVEHDLVTSGADQQLDLGATTTKVLKVGISKFAGVAGSASDIEVRINKPLF